MHYLAFIAGASAIHVATFLPHITHCLKDALNTSTLLLHLLIPYPARFLTCRARRSRARLSSRSMRTLDMIAISPVRKLCSVRASCSSRAVCRATKRGSDVRSAIANHGDPPALPPIPTLATCSSAIAADARSRFLFSRYVAWALEAMKGRPLVHCSARRAPAR